MKRRSLLAFAAMAAMLAVAALAVQQRGGSLLLLDWAHKAPAETPPLAVLLEMGLKDLKATDWSGKATVAGAKVVHREGYRFRTSDKLVDAGAWEASSHRGLRVPAKNPAVSKMERIATVGVVLHLADVKDDATLTIEPKDAGRAKQTVALKDVLGGKAHLLWDGAATVRLVSTASPVTAGSKNEDDYPAAAYGPDGTLWVAYVSYTVRDDSRRIEAPPFKKQPENFKAQYTPEFADQLWVKSYRGGKWSEPIAVTGPNESLIRCAIAVEGNGDIWMAYGAFRNGNHNIYMRPLHKEGGTYKPGAEELIPSKGRAPALSPVLCTNQNGQIQLAFQSTFKNEFWTSIGSRLDKLGAWVVGSTGTHHWSHSIAAGPNGAYAVANDEYSGDYDVVVHVGKVVGRVEGPNSKISAPRPVAASSKFEARPSLAYDPKGRLWIAYEEGLEAWGKDYGSLDPKRGNPLYSARSVRVVCLDTDGKLKRPAAELPTSTVQAPTMAGDALRTNQFERGTRYAYPKIGIDGKGRVWLTYRQSFGSRYSSHPGSYWLNFARRLDGDRWSDPIEIHHSDGLLDYRPALLPHKSGGLLVVHNTDGRYTTPEVINNDVYLSYLTLPGDPVEPKLVPHDPGKKDPKLVAKAKEEAEAVARIRKYRVDAGGKNYKLLRGEYHRHTEISWDGGADGSLEDMFRYSIDAAALDWIGNGDHDNGAGREYPWWLTQKYNDAYHVAGAFVPMFTYERSVSYPHGHRNVMFAQRGVRTLPRLAAEKGQMAVAGISPDDTKMLYRYLHELDGICAVHTSATGMGTDWRDNDAKVEPIVEIYQGDRMSYEKEGAPRAGYEAKTGKEPINIAGWYPKGFINHALDKGYKLGFQSSSDHWSTHISFFVILAEKNDRKSLLDAVKKRHCYGATDNIVLDVRSGTQVMGDELKTRAAPALQMTVIGTNALAKIDVLKDSKVVHTIKPQGREYRGAWTEPAPAAGTHYYYIRVEQADGELAWASPLWIDYRP